MASVIETPPPKDLTRCGICKEVIDKPKALSCLHTFCLECLREWGQHDEEYVTCPVVSCKKATPMPLDGVDGLPGNVFVESLIENSPLRSKKVPCVCCEVKDNLVVAKCLDCNGFLCQEGVDVHKKPFLKSHQVIKLEDVKTGKVDLRNMASTRKPTCSKHDGQALWFFCRSCDALICQICTVVNHRSPEHEYVELESVVSDHKKKLEQLVKENEVIKVQVEKNMQNALDAGQAADARMKEISEEIDKVTENIKKHVDAVCRAEKERLAKERADFVSKVSKEVASVEESLSSQNEALQTALNMANQILQTGSDYDIASVYQQITSVLEKNRQISPKTLSRDVTNLPEFFTNPICNNFTTIGNMRQRVSFTRAILEGRFGEGDVSKQPGVLNSVRGIATSSEGDIAIANNYGSIPVKVYSIGGKYKFCLDEQSKNAWDVATGPDGQFFVTTKGNKYVTVYGSDGHFQSQFAPVSPAGVSSDTAYTQPKCVAVSMSRVFIGEIKMKFISIHGLNGVHWSSILLNVAPNYMAITRQGTIVVCADQEVQIRDCSGHGGALLHTINAPEGVIKWVPLSVCCSSSDDDIFVFNSGSPVGIYRFSSSGSYLGCVNKDTKYEFMKGGLTFSQDGEKLLFAEGGTNVKIFRRE